jgi:hypothetical protein
MRVGGRSLKKIGGNFGRVIFRWRANRCRLLSDDVPLPLFFHDFVPSQNLENTKLSLTANKANISLATSVPIAARPQATLLE